MPASTRSRNRADLAHTSFLDHAQQLHLHRQRQVGDFVEEQRALVRGLEEAGAIAIGAGECALAVAEELGLHQRLGDGAAIDRDERVAGTRTERMQHSRGEFLAGARLAVDVNRHIALRQTRDQSAHVRHRGRLAEQALRQRCGRAIRIGHLERGLDERAQVVERHRLVQVVERAGLQRGDRVFGRRVGGHNGDGDVQFATGDELDDVHPAAVGHLHVGETEVVFTLEQLLARRRHARRARDVEAHLQQRELQQPRSLPGANPVEIPKRFSSPVPSHGIQVLARVVVNWDRAPIPDSSCSDPRPK